MAALHDRVRRLDELTAAAPAREMVERQRALVGAELGWAERRAAVARMLEG